MNNGNLITRFIINKKSGHVWQSVSKTADMILPGYSNVPASLTSFRSCVIPETTFQNAYVETEIVYDYVDFAIKRIIRLYPDCAVIGNDFYFMGKPVADWYNEDFIEKNLSDVQFVASGKIACCLPVMESVAFEGRHWRYRTVSLFEMTDYLNNLISVTDYQAYNERLYKGNLLFAQNSENEEGFFFLKESPSSLAQLKYPSGDFLAAYGKVKVIGMGIDENDIHPNQWTKSYSTVFGVFSQSEREALSTLKNYQSKERKIIPERDEMIMMNTWGDRGQGGSINEKFVIKEIELCSQLGITHFQIDDGWQTGKSPATTQGGSFDNIWDRDDYWIPDHHNFPNGLMPVVERGRKLGVEICLWFNPSYTNDYESWKRDAETLIRLNRQYGIRVFKIDGLRIHNKISEERVDSMLSLVSEILNNHVVFNLDVTADKRFGFLYKNRYGNIFLENRYTDFGNYYPYQTLRNLWMLSKYVPSRNLQVEFLNKWRNTIVYGNDPFAPAAYDFEYLFAITMMAQPLAWMEAHNLPAEAFKISRVIKRYREIQYDMHKGLILPIGDVPSGKSWTGFQSLLEGRGYFLLFRENSEEDLARMKTWLKGGTEVMCKRILGSGDDFKARSGDNGEISFKIAEKNSYSLYYY
ncbi:MAG: alpha-galactosidase, partial [Parabacteroides sp.]|nr:alpha-galactosidase [Parabacteroides sp.]